MLTGSKLSGVGRMGHSSKKMLAVPVASNAAAQSFSLYFVYEIAIVNRLRIRGAVFIKGETYHAAFQLVNQILRDFGIYPKTVLLKRSKGCGYPIAVCHFAIRGIRILVIKHHFRGSGAFPVFSGMPTRLKHLFPSPAVVEKPCPPTEYVSAAEENSNDTNPVSTFSPS